MKIDIKHVAKLARLKLEDSQVAKFEKEMTDILAMVENLPAISDDNIGLDVAHPMQLRPDEIRPSLSRQDVLRGAPKTEAGCIVVPKTVE